MHNTPTQLPTDAHNRWRIVAVCFVIIVISFGIRFNFGVFFDELIRNYNTSWKRAAVAGVFSTSLITFALSSTFVGWLLDWRGARWVVSAGLAIVAVGLFFTSRLTQLWHFYLAYGVVTAIGMSMLNLGVFSTIINRWFDKHPHSGLAIGVSFAGSGVGVLLLSPSIEWVISTHGWRVAYLVLVVLASCVALPLALVALHDPPQSSTTPATSGGAHTTIPMGYSVRQALHTPTLWLLMASGMLSLFTLRMVSVHQVAYMVDGAVPRAVAAQITGNAGLVTAVAFIVFGTVSDRIGREYAFVIGSIAQLIAIGLLMILPLSWLSQMVLLYAYALTWGVGEGSRTGLLTALLNDIFAGQSLGTIAGLFIATCAIGAALGSWLGGTLYDTYHTYIGAFAVSEVATIIATVCVIAVRVLQTHHTKGTHSLV